MRTYFKTETEEHSIGRSLNVKKKKKMGVRGQFLKKWNLYMQNLTKEWKQRPVVILQQTNFYNIFILRLWLRIIKRSDQGVQFVNFPSRIFYLIPFYMTVASYCYYEKVRITMRTAIVSYLLKYFHSFSAAERNIIESEDKFLLRNFHAKRVIIEIAIKKILNNCISGRLNNKYFPLNESSSLY